MHVSAYLSSRHSFIYETEPTPTRNKRETGGKKSTTKLATAGRFMISLLEEPRHGDNLEAEETWEDVENVVEPKKPSLGLGQGRGGLWAVGRG